MSVQHLDPEAVMPKTASQPMPSPTLSLEEKDEATLNGTPLPALNSLKHHGATDDDEFNPDLPFWMTFLALCITMFLGALDLTAVSTILPTIASDFNTDSAYWTGAAYGLCATSLMTFFGSFAFIFGRKPVFLASIILFMVGSAVTASAQNFTAVIIGRSLQGAGGGGIQVGVEIVTCDLCPPAVRGQYFGLVAAVWALASVLAPPIAGALGTSGKWRWLFYMNLPICAIALPIVWRYMNISAPKRTLGQRVRLMNPNNILFTCASTASTLALSWGGAVYDWDSPRVIVPLVLGLVGIFAYFFIERYLANPTIPWSVFETYTACIGLWTVFAHTLVVIAVIAYLPLYFQACLDATALQSGVDILPLAFTLAPFAIVGGIIITLTVHHKKVNLVGWAFMATGMGLMYMIEVETPHAYWKAFPVIGGIGMGLVFAGNQFPVIAECSPALQPAAMTVVAFLRSFGATFGLSTGQAVMQNELQKRLSPEIIASFGNVQNIVFAAVPHIKKTPEPAQTQMKDAFAKSASILWLFCAIFAAITFVISCFMKDVRLNMEFDATFRLKKTPKKEDEAKEAEKAVEKTA